MKLNHEYEYCKEQKEKPRLYKIGMFASMNHVTIKTLRYYDEQDILQPAYVDNENGYRYYLATQIADLHQILALKEIGFSLDEIRAFQNGISDKGILLTKKQQILNEISQLTAKLAKVESYLSEEVVDLTSPILVKKLPKVICATMETVMESFDTLFECMPVMGMEMERLGCVCQEPDYCFTNYLEQEDKDEHILVEICESVTELKQDSDKIKFKVFEEVEAACIFHKGSYNTLAKSYVKLLNYIEENGYQINGNVRESYIDGVWNKESCDEWLTQIQIPIRRVDDFFAE